MLVLVWCLCSVIYKKTSDMSDVEAVVALGSVLLGTAEPHHTHAYDYLTLLDFTQL